MSSVQKINFQPLHWVSAPKYKCEIFTQLGDYYTLQFLASGEVDLWIEGKYYHLNQPVFWCTRPNTLIHYKPDPENGIHHRYIAFKGRVVKNWDADGFFDFQFTQVPSSRDYPCVFDRMLKFIERGDNLSIMSGINILESIFLDIARGQLYSSSENLWLDFVLKEIEGEDGFRLDISKTAKKLQMGESTLRRKFRQSMGIALNEYCISRRIDFARRELVNSNKPIKQISHLLGYSHESFFIRQFTKLTNMSPMQFRKRHAIIAADQIV